MSEEFKLEPQLIKTQAKSERLLHVFQTIHNHIYANDGLSSEQTFTEMMKVLSLKVADEKSEGPPLFHVTPAELLKDSSGSFLSRVKKLEKRTKTYFGKRVTENLEVDLKPTTLAYVFNQLQHIDLRGSSRDIKGLAFQKFVSAEHRRGRGQFFTPEQVVDFCVRVLDPAAGEKVLDPACGTGGFISQAARHISKNAAKKKNGTLFVGLDINPMVATTGEVRLALEDVEEGHIIPQDGLADWPDVNRAISDRLGISTNCEGFFDVIVTNPPFGTQGRIRDEAVLARFELGHKWQEVDGGYVLTPHPQPGQVPDLVFIERCLDFLKPGGRMAIILPNGDLENSSLGYVRSYILSKAELLGVVHLPHDTFVPFGTGVKASVLFLKKKPARNHIEGAFFAQITRLGYQANKTCAPIYKRGANGLPEFNENDEPLLDEDYTELAQKALKWMDGKSVKAADNFFWIKNHRLIDRFDFEFHKPSHKTMSDSLVRQGAKPMGEVIEIIKRRPDILNFPEAEVRYVELSNVNVDYSELSGFSPMPVHELPSRASYELENGDIITAIAGNAIGTHKHMSALVTPEYAGCICTNGFRILRPKSGLLPLYLLNFLRSETFFRQIYRFRTGAAIPSLSDDDLLKVLIPMADMKIQLKVSKIIDESFALRRKSRELLTGLPTIGGF
jgi:type I restriction enzyme M protein